MFSLLQNIVIDFRSMFFFFFKSHLFLSAVCFYQDFGVLGSISIFVGKRDEVTSFYYMPLL